jgi:hypothetical protein
LLKIEMNSNQSNVRAGLSSLKINISNPPFENEAAPPSQRLEISPFEKYLMALENLQAPVEFTPGSYQEPSTPAFTPMAAPAAVRVSPASKFGPVTRSGYAIPPVDPMSYYSTPEPVQQSAPNPNASRRWTDFKTPTPDLSNAETFAPESTQGGAATPDLSQPIPAPDVAPPAAPSQPSNNLQDEFPGYAGLKLGDEVPGMPGTKIGDVIKDDSGNVWNWREGRWDLAKPPREDSYVRDDGAVVTPGGVSLIAPPVAPPTPQVPSNPTPETPAPPVSPVPEIKSPEIVEPTRTPFTFTQRPVIQPTPTRVQAVPYQGKPAIKPLIEPTEVSAPARRIAELLAPGYFKDINYDPDEILAAAMRSMGGRQARRSILNELQ